VLTEQKNTDCLQLDYLAARILSPGKLFVFWQLKEETVRFMAKYFNLDEQRIMISLRLYDAASSGQKDGLIHEMVIRPGITSWLFKGVSESRSYLAELGIMRGGESFFPLLRSNCIQSNNRSRDFLYSRTHSSAPQWDGKVSTYTYYQDLEGSSQK
jgi:hypothetical protein